MAGEINVKLYEYLKQSQVWKQAEEEIEPKINTLEPCGELEVLNQYIETYGKLSLLVENYVKLLEEDRTRILEAIVTLLEADANLINQ